MSDKIGADALTLRKLIREAEAVSDEAMIALARLKQAMLLARQNPDVPVDIGQRAIMRLVQAESQAVSMSSNIFRVHGDLNDVARIVCGPDEQIITPLEGSLPDQARPQAAPASGVPEHA
ncbi:hypothetical protein U4960_02055 [Altererythrobacter sp. H2]|uniref:hypothetical protein n=1 Tax=Altererythrobacter sp. H2 TaxID=3108391 RepID=UPI002B4C187E|nr:hypothetical protein [Altererythrobacter sp. H2]WRK96137.1 hypothetical protein U4960_02055 [Altererythrobacter sp. H2]